MAKARTQISAFISEATRESLERHVRATGVKKAHLIETAILHHLQALHELPEEVTLPPRLVVSKETGSVLLQSIEKPRQPTPATEELMRGDGGS